LTSPVFCTSVYNSGPPAVTWLLPGCPLPSASSVAIDQVNLIRRFQLVARLICVLRRLYAQAQGNAPNSLLLFLAVHLSSSVGRSSFKDPFPLPEPISRGAGHPVLLDPSRRCGTISSHHDRIQSLSISANMWHNHTGGAETNKKVPSSVCVTIASWACSS
jgi:hypothetical protein